MTGNKGLLSVCCLGYNHAEFIENSIRAIWNADYKNIEIIVVDDGSKDNSGEILTALQQQSPLPMTVILQDNTGKVGHNFNVALSKAKGEYVSFISLDDVLISDAIKPCIDYMNADKKCAFVAADCIQGVNGRGEPCDNVPPLKLATLSNPTVDDLLELEYSEFGAFYIQGTFFRKDIVSEVGGFDEDMTGDDLVLRTKVFRLMKNQNLSDFKIFHTPTCQYRIHGSNIHKNHLRQIRIVSEYLERYWPDRKNCEQFVAWAMNSLTQMDKKTWSTLFGMNKRTLSLLDEDKIIALYTKQDIQEKTLLKIPYLISVVRIKNFAEHSKKMVLTVLGKKMEFNYKKKEHNHG